MSQVWLGCSLREGHTLEFIIRKLLEHIASPCREGRRRDTGSGAPTTGRSPNHRRRGNQVLAWSLGGAALGIVGTYSSSIPEAAQISGGGYSTTVISRYMPRVHADSTCPAVWRRLGAVISCEGQMGLAPKAVSEQSEGFHRRHLHRHCVKSTRTSVCSPRKLRAHLLQGSPLLGQAYWCVERGTHTLKGNRPSVGPTLTTSAPATWDQTLHPIVR